MKPARTHRPAALAAVALLATAAAVRAEEVQVALEGRGLVAARLEQAPTDGGALRLRVGADALEVPRARALALLRADGGIDLPAVDEAEDRALALEARARPGEAFDAWREALARALAAGGALRGRPAAGGLVAATVEHVLLRLRALAGETGRHVDAAEAFTAALELEPADALAPLARDWARTWRAEALASLGEHALARADDEALGVLGAWWWLGPLDNERGTGFQAARDPAAAPFDPAATFPGKRGKVAWRRLPALPPRGVVPLDDLARPDDQGFVWAVTWVHAARDCEVALRLGSDEAVRAWVDGALVLERDARRPLRPDQDAVGARLRAGWNEVRLQVADQTGGWAFRARVSAPQGGPAPGVRPATLEEAAAPAALAASARGAAPGEPPAVVAALARDTFAARAARGGWRDPYRLGAWHLATKGHDQGEHPDRDALQAACEAAPGLAALRVLLAEAERTPAEFSVNKEENARRRALEAALALDPACAAATLELVEYYADDLGSVAQARTHLEAGLAAAGDDRPLALELWRLELERRAGRAALADAALARLVAAWEARVAREEVGALPARLVAEAYGLAGRREGAAAQLPWLDLYAALDQAETGALARMAQVLGGLGRHEEARGVLERALALAPLDPDLLAQAAGQHEGRGRLDEAAAALEAARALRPDDEELAARLGHLEARRGALDRAEALWARALELNPNLVDLREYLELRARHQGGEGAFEAAWLLDAAPLVAAARAEALDPRRTHRVLLRQTVVRLARDGTKSELTQEVVRAENEPGARELGTYQAVYASDQRLRVLAARVHRRDGRVEEVPVGAARGSRAGEFQTWRQYGVRFPPLEPGDAIEVRYRTDDLAQGFFGDYYGHTAFFQDQVHVDRVRYAVLAPADRKLHVHLRGLDPGVHTTRREGDEQVHVFERRGVPPLDGEPRMPWAKEVVPLVQVSTFADWDQFSRWYWGLVRGQHEADPAIKAKVAELVAGAATPEEKIRRIYEYVVTDIRYNASWEFGIHGFKPYNATQIYARKFGDCKDKSTLINTMLREVGIRSWPVLIFGEDGRGSEDLTLPLMNHFNHCISWVDWGEGGLFLDGTAEHHPFGTLPTMDYGARVVVITPERGVVRDIPFRGPEANAVREEHRVVVDDEGGARLASVIEGTGTFGVVLRGLLLTEGRRKEALEPRVGRALEGAKLEAVRASDPRDLRAPVRVELDVRAPRLVRDAAGGGKELVEVRSWLFDQLYLRGQALSDIAADAERSFDVVLPVPSGVEETVVYELPAGHAVESLPAPVVIESDLLEYRRELVVEGGALRARRVLRIKAQRVPVARYAELREALGRIDRAERERPRLRVAPRGERP